MGNRTIYKSEEGKKYIGQHYENYINSFNVG